MHTARYFSEKSHGVLQCELCPHKCILSEGETGICKVRTNKNGRLTADSYGRISAIAEDPIEKKPLYHYYPGHRILSIGSVGCNFNCLHCQNEQISQCIGISPGSLKKYKSQQIIEMCGTLSPPLLAFTYNEPVVSYEFVLETAKLGNDHDIHCVLVTNGYINTDPILELLPFIDAFNVDLKAFNNEFYKRITGGGLQPVLNTLHDIKKSGKHIEITYLVVPGYNDDPEEFRKMAQYLGKEFGHSQVLHISRYYPRFRMGMPPTPLDVIGELVGIAREYLDFVYPGNTGFEHDSNTYCPDCKNLMIKRMGYETSVEGLEAGKCRFCKNELNIIQ